MASFGSSLRDLVLLMAQDARELKLSQTASSLTVLTLMAVVPVVAVAWMVLTALPAFAGLKGGLEDFIRTSVFLPSISATVMNAINQFVGAAQRLSALGSVLFLATALGAMLTIDRTLNQIWATPQPRPLWQRVALYWTMLSVGPVLLGGALALQLRARGSLRALPVLAEGLAAISPTLVITAALFALYRLAPNTRVRSRHALTGALCAALLLEALRLGLTTYLRIVPATTLVYGAFAALPIFLTWLFAAWLSVLLGASLAARLPGWGRGIAVRQALPAAQYALHLRVLQQVIAQADRGGLKARACADLLGQDARQAEAVAHRLARLGYVLRVWPVQAGPASTGSIWQELWLPAPGWQDRSLRVLFEQFWGGRPQAGRPVLDPGSDSLDWPISRLGWAATAPEQGEPPPASRS
jgi:membrane protein